MMNYQNNEFDHEIEVIDKAIFHSRKEAIKKLPELIFNIDIADEEFSPLMPECIYNFGISLSRRLELKELYDEYFLQEFQQQIIYLKCMICRKNLVLAQLKNQVRESIRCNYILQHMDSQYRSHELFDPATLHLIKNFSIPYHFSIA